MPTGDVKTTFVATATITMSLASIATSATFVAGAESASQANSSLYTDARLTGKITVGTTPTINTQIRLYVFAAMDDTPTWPDVMDGTDSVETLTSVGVGEGFLKLAAIINVDAVTSNVAYNFTSVPFSELFGNVPKNWGVFLAHNTGVNLHATGGNHLVKVDYWHYNVSP